MPFLKQSGGPFELEASMAGVKLGTRVLQIGVGGGLIAALAKRAGLTGHACCVVENQAAAESVDKAAAKEGALVEVKVAPPGDVPYESDSFDLAVLKDVIGEMTPAHRVGTVQQAWRVLRPGGRCLVIERAARGGVGALFSRRTFDQHYIRHGKAQGALEAEGFRPVRVLAERGNLIFVEGLKPMHQGQETGEKRS